ncbi:MAG TPA: response regulator transcription factor [Candidatus Lumbricidophila sp.]|nr:response regulator transcription factor [Candidatus Lumbricidophila sp.]
MISVLLVDDDPLVRSALGLMLGGGAINIVGEASDGKQAVAAWRANRTDVVLMDIRMPVMDGLEATKILVAEPFPPRVIMLTTFDADEYVVAAVQAGADGFLLKDTSPADIVAAITRVNDGDAVLSPTATAALVRTARNGADAPDRSGAARALLDTLTERELEVAQAVGRGLSNAEIAAELFFSVPTVKAHISRLFEKLGATNRVQIAICVHDAGLD